MFNQISNLIQTRADKPGISVTPTAYPPPPLKQLFANMISMAQMAIILLLFVNDKALPEPMRENKMMSFFVVFLLGQMVSSTLVKTEAFEIYMGRKLIWSSLAEHRMPNLQDLVMGFREVGVTINTQR